MFGIYIYNNKKKKNLFNDIGIYIYIYIYDFSM